MHRLSFALLRSAISIGSLLASVTAQLQVCGSHELNELAAHTRRVLADQEATNGYELWRFVAAHLRLGDVARARSLLRNHDLTTEPELVLAAFATLQRTTGEQVLTEPRQTALAAALHKAEQLAFASFEKAALQIHGRYCLAQLDATDQRLRHEQIATTRLLALECETWQPGRGHYRPLPCSGQLLVPTAADASILVPLSFGMLLASGDRLTRHLTSTLAAAASGSELRWQQTASTTTTAALLLIAAAQLGDEAAMQKTFATVVKQRAANPTIAALHLDAALQAITGVRLAAGGGLGDRWLRVRPWLPTHTTSLELRAMPAQGNVFGLLLRRATGATKLHVEVKAEQQPQHEISLVVGNHYEQFATRILDAKPFVCELATGTPTEKTALSSHAKAQHDPTDAIGRGRK